MSTHYTAYDKAAGEHSDAYEGYPLRAKTDRSARIEAKKLSAEKGWKDVGITFHRDSDGCRGSLDV